MTQMHKGPGLVAALLALAAAGCQQETVLPAPSASASASALPAPAAAPSAAAPSDLKPGPNDKILTITSSNPDVAVTGVFLDGRPLQSEGLGTATARVLLVADAEEGGGTPCTTEGLEVRLANAIILRPLANICTAKYALAVSAAKQAPPPVTAPEEFSWQLGDREGSKQLYFGIPETDATAFLASCRKGEMRAKAIFFEEGGPSPVVDLYGPDRVLRYALFRSGAGSSEEAPSNQIALASDDPFWAMLRRGALVPYRISKGDFRALDSRQGTDQIGEFLAWCEGA